MVKRIYHWLSHLIKKYHLDAFRDVAIFVTILLFFHFVWKAFASNIFTVGFIRSSANWLALQVYLESKWVIDLVTARITAFDQLYIGGSLRHNVFYFAENNGYVSVNASCSGLKQFYQWFFLMTLFPGPWRPKLWFIPMGLVVIHLVNVFRIIAMVFVTIHLAEHWDFIHDWILRPFFYVVMFMLWVWWNEKFHLKYKRKKAATS
jgi:exosortase/archaeosortase family protein